MQTSVDLRPSGRLVEARAHACWVILKKAVTVRFTQLAAHVQLLLAASDTAEIFEAGWARPRLRAIHVGHHHWHGCLSGVLHVLHVIHWGRAGGHRVEWQVTSALPCGQVRCPGSAVYWGFVAIALQRATVRIWCLHLLLQLWQSSCSIGLGVLVAGQGGCGGDTAPVAVAGVEPAILNTTRDTASVPLDSEPEPSHAVRCAHGHRRMPKTVPHDRLCPRLKGQR